MWKKLDVPGPCCEINEAGEIRQKYAILYGEVLRDFVRPPSIDRNGYKIMNFRGNGEQKLHRIHMLVARHFVPNPKRCSFVKFKDDDKLNTHKSNLEWTNKRPVKKAFHAVGKLNEREVAYIRTKLSQGEPQIRLARQFGVHRSLISHIAAGRRH